jgi:hypothetical protein
VIRFKLNDMKEKTSITQWIEVDTMPKESGVYEVWDRGELSEAHWNGKAWRETQRTLTTPIGGRLRAEIKPTHYCKIKPPLNN